VLVTATNSNCIDAKIAEDAKDLLTKIGMETSLR
jgi:hypothetical protein